MKRYVIFAGVNGAGKSTLYQTFPRYQQMNRINIKFLERLEIGKSPVTL